jgi:hypothetical protein
MSRCDPFDAISSAVDLDDPAQWSNAQRFMVDALERVVASLPSSAQAAVSVAKRHLAGRASVGSVAAERVKLWGEIEGRDQADEPDVLRIRATICALHVIDEQSPLDRLAYFLTLWERSSLSMVELAGAIRDAYDVIYRADS